MRCVCPSARAMRAIELGQKYGRAYRRQILHFSRYNYNNNNKIHDTRGVRLNSACWLTLISNVLNVCSLIFKVWRERGREIFILVISLFLSLSLVLAQDAGNGLSRESRDLENADYCCDVTTIHPVYDTSVSKGASTPQVRHERVPVVVPSSRPIYRKWLAANHSGLFNRQLFPNET